MKEELLERLIFHHPIDKAEQRDLIETINFVRNHKSIVEDEDIHITASAFVLNADKSKTLLVKHKKTGLWQQLGGHIEPCDNFLIEAALREASEESGKNDIEIFNDGKIFNVVIYHNIKNDITHTHLDVWFLFISKTEELSPTEGQELKWFSWQEFEHLNKMQKDIGLLRAFKKWRLIK